MGHITGLLLLLWAGATVSTVLDLQKRIIGGQRCNDNERQYHVKLTDRNNNFMCGGSLISNQWILTAEHCNAPVLKAVVGVHPGPGTPQDIIDHKIYKDKDDNNRDRTHDIMLLKLKDPVTGITSVPLPDCNNRPNVKDVIQIAGHGDPTTRPGDKHGCGESPTLQCAEADLIDCKPFMECLKQSNPTAHAELNYLHLLCAERTGVDTCPGDSGGGVLYKGMIYGVHKGSGEYACTVPMRYMDVCGYKDWITTTAGVQFP